MSKPAADALAPASARESWQFLRTLPSAPSKAKLALVFGIFTLTILMMNLGSQVLGRLVDIIQGGEVPVIGSGRNAMIAALWIIAACLIVEVSGRALGGYLINARTRRLAVDLRTAALDSVLRAPVPRVMELGTGNVITRLSKDIDTVVTAVAMMGERLAVTIFILPLTFLTMAFIHPAYLLLCMLAVAVMYPFIKGTIRDIPAVANAVSTVEARRNNVLLDTIRALETLRIFRLDGWATRRMEDYSWYTVQAWGDKVPLINRIIGQGSIAF